jgi:predicted O-linked N-acetylglucosamine transferase (SPINDLY family)
VSNPIAKQAHTYLIIFLTALVQLSFFQGARNEIFAMKPAPIQVSYMGFPGTTGATYIDYLVTDEVRNTAGCYQANLLTHLHAF